ncbi:MAG: hypothetical protein RI895_1132 [Actinomycetota bacterium]
MAEILTRFKGDLKANTVLGVCVALVLYVANGIRISIENFNIHSWTLSELLINYQGGFVRRGIYGELLFQTSNPIYFATLFQKVALIFVLIGVIAILFFETSNVSRLLFTATIVFAPGGMHDMKVGGNEFTGGEWEYLDRKEIWFYCAIICFYFTVKFLNNRPVIYGLVFSIVSILLILHHELFFVFAIVIYTTLLLSKKFKFRSLQTLVASFYYLMILGTFALVTSFHGNEKVSYAIWSSYQGKYSEAVYEPGAIGAISWSITDSHVLASTIISAGSTLYYIYFALISILMLLLYSIVSFRSKANLFLAILLNGGIFVGCLLTSYIFLDLGRLISMYTIVTLLGLNVLHASLNKSEIRGDLRYSMKHPVSEIFQKNFILFCIFCYLIFISLITRVPHCCPQPNEIPLRGFLGLM